MFSETYTGGTVRMVREATRHLPQPPAIYGHNAGIGIKTRGICARSSTSWPGLTASISARQPRFDRARHISARTEPNGSPRNRHSRGQSPGSIPR